MHLSGENAKGLSIEREVIAVNPERVPCRGSGLRGSERCGEKATES